MDKKLGKKEKPMSPLEKGAHIVIMVHMGKGKKPKDVKKSKEESDSEMEESEE